MRSRFTPVAFVVCLIASLALVAVGCSSAKKTKPFAGVSLLNGSSKMSPGLAQNEGDSGLTAFVLKLRLSKTISTGISVNWSTENGTSPADGAVDVLATSGSDYVAASGSVTFVPSGLIEKTFTVNVNGDTTKEKSEYFFINLAISDTSVPLYKERYRVEIRTDDMDVSGEISGEVLAGVTINIEDSAGNVLATGITDVAGLFTVNSVPSGSLYVVPVMAGFDFYELRNGAYVAMPRKPISVSVGNDVTGVKLVAITNVLPTNVIFVNENALGTGTGSDWQNAYKYLRDGMTDYNQTISLGYITGDFGIRGFNANNRLRAGLRTEVWIARGVYNPTQTHDSGLTGVDNSHYFCFPTAGSPVTVIGGFSGGETSPLLRLIDGNPTVLTGDLSDPPNDTGSGSTMGENSQNVIWQRYSPVAFDGLFIEGGFNGTRGAGIYAPGGEVTLLSNCRVSNCKSVGDGGGLYGQGTAISNTIFSGNIAGGNGGGAYIIGCLGVSGSIFSSNESGITGGGVFLEQPAMSTFFNNSYLSGNTSASYGGGIYCLYPPPLPFSWWFLTNVVVGNQASTNQGGGVRIYANASWGGMYSNTIAYNRASDGGGVAIYGGANPFVDNIVYFNEGTAGTATTDASHQMNITNGAQVIIVNNCIEGGMRWNFQYGGSWEHDEILVEDGAAVTDNPDGFNGIPSTTNNTLDYPAALHGAGRNFPEDPRFYPISTGQFTSISSIDDGTGGYENFLAYKGEVRYRDETPNWSGSPIGTFIRLSSAAPNQYFIVDRYAANKVVEVLTNIGTIAGQNYTVYNYHLIASSPCIGRAWSASGTDIEGNARDAVAPAKNDVGAYEY